MSRILVTGSSGFIGRSLVPFLQSKGNEVSRLLRKNGGDLSWNPEKGEVHPGQLEGFDAVVHLAGDNIASGRWTKRKKESIFLSRCRDTWLLSQALSRLKNRPKVFFSASAVGFYGDRGEEILTEESAAGSGFLPDVCLKWEAASRSLEASGVRVVHARFGAVLSPEGGMLKRVLPLFRWGLGGRLGSGKQWMSWIALSDLVRAIDFVLRQGGAGVYNFTAPEPVTNSAFTKALAKALHRPAVLPVPACMLRLALGEMANELLLASARVLPKRLEKEGFNFEKSRIELLSFF